MKKHGAEFGICSIALNTYALWYRRAAMSKPLAGPFCRGEARWDLGAAGTENEFEG